MSIAMDDASSGASGKMSAAARKNANGGAMLTLA
jgi:hypothetical protein